MIFKYKLMDATSRGILQNISPILLDLDSEIELSFFMANDKPIETELYVIITDSALTEHKYKMPYDGFITLPKALIKPQTLFVSVIAVTAGEVTKRFRCNNIKLTKLSDMAQLKVEAAIDIQEVLNSYKKLENELNRLTSDVNVLKNQLNGQAATAVNLQEDKKRKEEIINELINRVELLEGNYDPTL